MRIGITEIKRPASEAKELEPIVIESAGGRVKKTASRKGKVKKANT
jgi:hypothetical protein